MNQRTAKKIRIMAAVFSACAISLNVGRLVASLPNERFTLDVPYKVEKRVKKGNNKLALKKK